jgi:hypothetical protein
VVVDEEVELDDALLLVIGIADVVLPAAAVVVVVVDVEEAVGVAFDGDAAAREACERFTASVAEPGRTGTNWR